MVRPAAGGTLRQQTSTELPGCFEVRECGGKASDAGRHVVGGQTGDNRSGGVQQIAKDRGESGVHDVVAQQPSTVAGARLEGPREPADIARDGSAIGVDEQLVRGENRTERGGDLLL